MKFTQVLGVAGVGLASVLSSCESKQDVKATAATMPMKTDPDESPSLTLGTWECNLVRLYTAENPTVKNFFEAGQHIKLVCDTTKGSQADKVAAMTDIYFEENKAWIKDHPHENLALNLLQAKDADEQPLYYQDGSKVFDDVTLTIKTPIGETSGVRLWPEKKLGLQ